MRAVPRGHATPHVRETQLRWLRGDDWLVIAVSDWVFEYTGKESVCLRTHPRAFVVRLRPPSASLTPLRPSRGAQRVAKLIGARVYPHYVTSRVRVVVDVARVGGISVFRRRSRVRCWCAGCIRRQRIFGIHLAQLRRPKLAQPLHQNLARVAWPRHVLFFVTPVWLVSG